jgi:hypothetical protein
MIYPYKERCTIYSIYDWEHDVEVYRNLHNNKYSIRCSKSKLVIAHADEIGLLDVKFVVHKAGREKVLNEQRKNVHAYAKGKISMIHYPSWRVDRAVKYNPYRFGFFFDAKTKEVVKEADMCYISLEGMLTYKSKEKC